MNREYKTNKLHLPEFINQIHQLQCMKTEQFKEYGCLVYIFELDNGKIRRKVNDKYYPFDNTGTRIDKIKSVEHFLKLQEGEVFTVLDKSIDFRYYNV